MQFSIDTTETIEEQATTNTRYNFISEWSVSGQYFHSIYTVLIYIIQYNGVVSRSKTELIHNMKLLDCY